MERKERVGDLPTLLESLLALGEDLIDACQDRRLEIQPCITTPLYNQLMYSGARDLEDSQPPFGIIVSES